MERNLAKRKAVILDLRGRTPSTVGKPKASVTYYSWSKISAAVREAGGGDVQPRSLKQWAKKNCPEVLAR